MTEALSENSTAIWIKQLEKRFSDWWKEARGDQGWQASAKAFGLGIGYLIAAIIGIFFIVWLYRKISRLDVWRRIRERLQRAKQNSVVEFYERMQTVLANQGFVRPAHQTPLEFAVALRMPEAVKITEKYNRVRFGEKNLSTDETVEIEDWLKNLEAKNKKS